MLLKQAGKLQMIDCSCASLIKKPPPLRPPLKYGCCATAYGRLLCLQSMNTVMDDNKMLTLASNERIPLTPSMRLLLEINHMNHCSPATVSRGGVIFVNAEDVGWKPVSPF